MGPVSNVKATLSPANPKVGDQMSVAATGLEPNQVATLRVHSAHPGEDDLSITAHADGGGTMAYPFWHVYLSEGYYALGVEVDGRVVATTSVEVAA